MAVSWAGPRYAMGINMKTILKYIAMTMFTIGLSYLCFILPPELSSLQDSKTVGHINLETLEETKVELQQQMSMLEKINLLSSQDINTNGITIKQGKELTEDKVREVCKDEIQKLKDLGILGPIDINFDKDKMSSIINFYISTADPSKSVIVWNAIFMHDDNYIVISLDDETGKIIGFVTNKADDIYPQGGNFEDIIKELGNYLGLEVEVKEMKASDLSGSFDTKIYYKNLGMDVGFSDGEQQLESNVYMYKTGFSIGVYDNHIYEIAKKNNLK